MSEMTKDEINTGLFDELKVARKTIETLQANTWRIRALEAEKRAQQLQLVVEGLYRYCQAPAAAGSDEPSAASVKE